jgi:single-strand DNA-binding protein
MVNKHIILGRVGSDPELNHTPNGKPVATFRVATNEEWTDSATGQREESTEWHQIEVWNKRAEACSQYLTKGRLVYIEGSHHTQTWEKDGVKRSKSFIRARIVKFLPKN